FPSPVGPPLSPLGRVAVLRLRECSFRLRHVLRDLCRQFSRARERDLVTQSLHESDLNLFAVDVSGEVEKISLEHTLAGAERRPDSERRRRLETSLPHLGPHRVDPVAWPEPLLRQGEA